jgi:hypothetical protein
VYLFTPTYTHTRAHDHSPLLLLCAVRCPAVAVQRGNYQASFMLFPTAGGGLYVRNEIFRTGPGVLALNNASGGELAQSFIGKYFEIFDSDRRGLAGIYVSGCKRLPAALLPCCLAAFGCVHGARPRGSPV